MQQEIQITQPTGPLDNSRNKGDRDDNLTYPDKTSPPPFGSRAEARFQLRSEFRHLFEKSHLAVLGTVYSLTLNPRFCNCGSIASKVVRFGLPLVSGLVALRLAAALAIISDFRISLATK